MNHLGKANATVIDPVCGMTIDPATAAASSVSNDETYYFCSRSCETKFASGSAEGSGATVATPARASCCSDPGKVRTP